MPYIGNAPTALPINASDLIGTLAEARLPIGITVTESLALVAMTSGTTKDVTGIPAGVVQVIVSLAGLSTAGSSSGVIMQIGDSGGLETTGYVSAGQALSVGGTGSVISATNAFMISTGPPAAETSNGQIILSLADPATNKWVCGGSFTNGTNTFNFSGSKSLSGTLDQFRLTVNNGTDTFDAGTMFVTYQRVTS